MLNIKMTTAAQNYIFSDFTEEELEKEFERLEKDPIRLLKEVINKFYMDLRKKGKDVLLVQPFRDQSREICYKLPSEKNPQVS